MSLHPLQSFKRAYRAHQNKISHGRKPLSFIWNVHTHSVVLHLCPSFAQTILLLFQILNWSDMRGLHVQMFHVESTLKTMHKHTHIHNTCQLFKWGMKYGGNLYEVCFIVSRFACKWTTPRRLRYSIQCIMHIHHLRCRQCCQYLW